MKNHNQLTMIRRIIFLLTTAALVLLIFGFEKAAAISIGAAIATTIYFFTKTNFFIMANQADIQAKLDEVLFGIGTISSNQAEIAADLSEALDEVVTTITDLTDAVNNGEVGAALSDKTDAVHAAVATAVEASNAIKAQAQALADIVPNEPPVEPPVEGSISWPGAVRFPAAFKTK